MDKQAKINKDVVTKFEAMEKILKNLDGKVTEVGSSIREVFIMMKMLETQVGQLARRPMVTKKNFRDNPKVPRWRRLLKLIRERWCDNPTQDNSVLSPKPLLLVIKR
jgi:hypothetical protein